MLSVEGMLEVYWRNVIMKNNNVKNNKKNTRKERCISDILLQMDAYDDLVEYIGSISKSIGIQCRLNKILDTYEGKTPKDILLNDLIKKYNDTAQIHYPEAYRGFFRSYAAIDRKKYIKRFKKLILEAIRRRYSCGYDYAGMDYKTVVSAIEDFFDYIL